MTTTTQTLTTTCVPLPGGRRFEATLFRTADGAATDLVLSVSFDPEGQGWRSQAGVLALPPDALSEIVGALRELEGVR